MQPLFHHITTLPRFNLRIPQPSVFSFFLYHIFPSSKQVHERFPELGVDEEVHEEVGEVENEEEVVRQTWQLGARDRSRKRN